MAPLPESHPLRRLFTGLTEHTFLVELGWAEPKLIDYMAELLVRFVHRDAIWSIRDAGDRPIEELASMVLAAEDSQCKGDARREVFRQVGDVALFWTGVYPEALGRRSGCPGLAAIYQAQGKRSYYLASTYVDTPTQAEESQILRRLSEDFERCAEGLRMVRWHWEHPERVA